MTKKVFLECSVQELKSEISTEIVDKMTMIIQSLLMIENKKKLELYTIDELVKLFKVDRTTIYNWKNKGRLKPILIENRVYFLKSDIENLLKPMTYSLDEQKFIN